jgi:toxin YoeB
MMTVTFHQRAFKEYQEWAMEDKKVFAKINGFIKEIYRTPFEGTGQPEPLKHDLSGCWSRHITKEHRIVYVIEKETLVIISCKYHY